MGNDQSSGISSYDSYGQYDTSNTAPDVDRQYDHNVSPTVKVCASATVTGERAAPQDITAKNKMDMLLTSSKAPICPISDVDIDRYENYSYKSGHAAIYKRDHNALPGFSRLWVAQNIFSRHETWYPASISGEFIGHIRGSGENLHFSGEHCMVRVAKTGQLMPLNSYRRYFMRMQKENQNYMR